MKPEDDKGCWNCTDDNATENLKRMFVGIAQTDHIRQGESPARRAVFRKLHGVVKGYFEIQKNLPEEYRVGVFDGNKGSFEAWVRFSSDIAPTAPDLRSTCGIAIKLFGVDGEKLLGDGKTQDFILQNHPVFFVDTAQDMCEFTKAGVVDGDYDSYLREHPRTKKILKEMQKIELSVLNATYWSGLPYKFGAKTYVKYQLAPEQKAHAQPPSDDPNYLASDLTSRLLKSEARFKFMVQFYIDDQKTPLDQATREWKEDDSAFIHTATLVLPRQDIAAPGQAAYGENLAFNPWHSLEKHQPVGSVSDARKVVYAASADLRRNVNGVTTREPNQPRPALVLSEPEDDCIVMAAIYPAIGVARLGNSQDEFFIGPEVPDPLPQPPGFYRDAKQALKRQAARFRVYGLNAEGKIVKELTAENAEIQWSVHLANKKSAWYQFQLALDIPEASSALPSLLRNASEADRSKLVIDPGLATIHGINQSGNPLNGKFMGNEVYLGELKTDDAGRLIVLGGRGKSASFDGSKALTFANNEGWHDDISDGPVTADVTYNGQKLERVDPAWVIVAPPNYGPMQKSVRTMWDVMRDVAIQAGLLQKPVRPSFEKDIRPLFERMSRLQWVNAGFAAAFGWKGPNDFATPEWLAQLADPGTNRKEMRQTVANHFRVFERDSWSPTPWPWLYGDAMNIPAAETPRQNASLTDTQLWFLQQWADGNFEADYDPEPKPPRKLDEVPVAEQGDVLNQASMEYCLADAFHPGCEMTWPMRSQSMYMAPFRLRNAELEWKKAHPGESWQEPQHGEELIPDTLNRPNGPLAGQVPGGLTRWMAVPWQTDTASCRSGYLQVYDPYLPTFWAARVPNQVLTQENYEIVISPDRDLSERLAAFANRAAWIRLLSPTGNETYTDQINNMIQDYGKMGVVEVREGPSDAEGKKYFPAEIEVEQLDQEHAQKWHALRSEAARPIAGEAPHKHPALGDNVDLTGIEKVRRFPYGLRR